MLFFIIGFFTWINGPLITFVKLAFDLDEIKAFLVVFVFYISYFLLALPAAAVRLAIRRLLDLPEPEAPATSASAAPAATPGSTPCSATAATTPCWASGATIRSTAAPGTT